MDGRYMIYLPHVPLGLEIPKKNVMEMLENGWIEGNEMSGFSVTEKGREHLRNVSDIG